MLYYLFELLQQTDFPGARLMSYITFRSGAALVLSIFIAIFIGRRIIDRLQMMQVGEIIRDLGLEGQMKKTGTPTMGGIIIIISIMVLAVGFSKPNFWTLDNGKNLIINIAPRFIIAAGVSGCLITKGTDLSAGRLVGLSACVAATVLSLIHI